MASFIRVHLPDAPLIKTMKDSWHPHPGLWEPSPPWLSATVWKVFDDVAVVYQDRVLFEGHSLEVSTQSIFQLAPDDPCNQIYLLQLEPKGWAPKTAEDASAWVQGIVAGLKAGGAKNDHPYGAASDRAPINDPAFWRQCIEEASSHTVFMRLKPGWEIRIYFNCSHDGPLAGVALRSATFSTDINKIDCHGGEVQSQ